MSGNTKRIPINRSPRSHFTDEMLDLYGDLRELRCTCSDGNLRGEGKCRGCRRWRQLYPQFESMVRAVTPWIRPWFTPNFGLVETASSAELARMKASPAENVSRA